MAEQYLFILGRQPQLSVAEIAAVARARQLAITWQTITASYALVEGDITPDFFKQLAGSIKLAQVLAEVEYKPNIIRDFVFNYLSSLTGGCLFGFSWYGHKIPSWLKPMGLELKREIKDSGRRARLVESRQDVLSSVVVQKNHLLPPRGTEFILQPFSETRIIIARTVAVQEFAEWSERDYGRPERDSRVGMLPPKLARLMINLTQGELAEPLLDPFCGSGTVLQEAVALGYKSIWGSDIDKQGIERTAANLQWLRQKHPEWQFEEKLLAADVRQLKTQLKDIKFGAMVTEPYLGPTSRIFDIKQYQAVAKDLVSLYRLALKNLAVLILPGRRLVMVWPVFHLGAKLLYLPLVNELSSLGWKVENILPPQAPPAWCDKRGSLLYERPGQRVGREVFVLRKV
ncbi:MAG: hypothetical protein HY973_00930 [Candidatus Kerfeldbacteria bacterium]|nr:hypothetical protein [Candidatus Kerfeldbacteria bacterium]